MKIEIEHVCCDYGSVKVLKNIRFCVTEGDFVGIIGPNGSGKTTLLRCISGVLKPRLGTILLDNYDVHNLAPRELAKKMSMVSQSSNISFEFTALDIVLMGRTPYLPRFKMETLEDLEIAKSSMLSTDTWHLRERLITQLSGGETQRVIIARALAQQPRVLLLDEPTTHLDISYQLEILQCVQRLNLEHGVIVIAVLHDLNLAARYCRKLLMLKNGRIFAAGTPEEVLTKKNISSVYNVEVLVEKNPVTNSVTVVPVSPIKNPTG